MSRPGWDDLPGWLVPFNWNVFLRKQGHLIRAHGLTRSRLGRIAALMALLAANQATWLIDNFAAPSWRRVRLNGPVFIIGHQRTGTTLLHRTLASDPDALALTLRQMLIPSISGQRLIDGALRVDARRGGRLRGWMTRLQNRNMADMDAIHRTRLGAIEEDEFLLFMAYRSGMVVNESPALAEVPALGRLLDFTSWTEAERGKALGWYRACLMKAVYRAEVAAPNPRRWVVGKNPAFSQRIADLLKVFPHAKFIHLVRNPLETVPSRLSLVRAVWRMRYPGFTELSPADVEAVVADSARTYLLPLRDLAALPPESAITIRYEALLDDLPGVLTRIYDQLGLSGPPPAPAPPLDTGRSQHSYSLGEFGLTEEGLRRRLAPAFAAHGF